MATISVVVDSGALPADNEADDVDDELDAVSRIFLRLKRALWCDLDDNAVAADDGGDVADPAEQEDSQLPPFPQNEEEANALTVAQLKTLLRARDLPQYGRKELLIRRLLESHAELRRLEALANARRDELTAMTCKQLQDILSKRSLAISGLKAVLVERLLASEMFENLRWIEDARSESPELADIHIGTGRADAGSSGPIQEQIESWEPRDLFVSHLQLTPALQQQHVGCVDLIDLLVSNTNLYARDERGNTRWKEGGDIARDEMLAFLGVHILMGITVKPQISDYWDQTFGDPMISNIFTRDRFKEIERFLSLVGIPPPSVHSTAAAKAAAEAEAKERSVNDPLYKVRALIDTFHFNSTRLWNAHSQLVIDEHMLRFTGRLYFLVYNPDKPNPWVSPHERECSRTSPYDDLVAQQGILIRKLSDSTGYLLSFVVYSRMDDRPARQQQREQEQPLQNDDPEQVDPEQVDPEPPQQQQAAASSSRPRRRSTPFLSPAPDRTMEHIRAVEESAGGVAAPFGETIRLVLFLLKVLPRGRLFRLFTDRYYTSPTLARVLMLRNIYLTGTVNTNRAGMPASFMSRKPATGQWTVAVSQPGIALVYFGDTKPVPILTTSCSPFETAAIEKWYRGASQPNLIEAPRVVQQYRQGMGAVDHHNQHQCYYSVSDRRHYRWWVKLFFCMVDYAIINAWIIHCNRARNNSSPRKQLEFRKELALALINNFCSRKRPRQGSVSSPLGPGPHLVRRLFEQPRKCQHCKQARTAFGCSTCSVALCVNNTDCFFNYHQ